MSTASPAPSASETERTLLMEHILAAPPADAFRAFTDVELVKQWWGPEGFTAPEASLDVRPGGAWRIRMTGPDGEHVVSGTYREITPPKRLVMTWAWETDGKRGHETVVDVTFEAMGSGTRLRLVQRLFETAEQAANHRWGWTSTFKSLDRLFA
jgi:uncharacterized protein YndB with AHSA1/START domain